VCDRGYLRHQRQWRATVAERARRYVVEVESDVVVPVAAVSSKAEHAARTLRPKLAAAWRNYLVALEPTPVERSSTELVLAGIGLSEPDRVLAKLDVDRTVAPVSRMFRGGASEASARLDRFLARGLPSYMESSRRPEADDTSTLSPYLHFGQISPVEIALAAGASDAQVGENERKFLDELVVRRELACNFVAYTPDYDTYEALPPWARQTLEKHARDPRPHCYEKRQLKAAKTHDPYWNAAMREMRATGFLHNYLRMYWGKKILEWSATPQQAFRTTLALNNEYFLDGRDPNSYANVAWIFGLHDRPWYDRPIFGSVRYMAASGLERKLDMEAYLARVEERVERAG
jgi:deoxyribodipyrimidine photo-lyase